MSVSWVAEIAIPGCEGYPVVCRLEHLYKVPFVPVVHSDKQTLARLITLLSPFWTNPDSSCRLLERRSGKAFLRRLIYHAPRGRRLLNRSFYFPFQDVSFPFWSFGCFVPFLIGACCIYVLPCQTPFFTIGCQVAVSEYMATGREGWREWGLPAWRVADVLGVSIVTQEKSP